MQKGSESYPKLIFNFKSCNPSGWLKNYDLFTLFVQILLIKHQKLSNHIYSKLFFIRLNLSLL